MSPEDKAKFEAITAKHNYKPAPVAGASDWYTVTTPKAKTIEAPSLKERVSADITKAGETAQQAIAGEGEFAGQTPIRRGVEATAAAFGAIPKVAGEVMPEPIRKGVEKVGETVGGAVNWLADKLGSTQLAQDFVTKHPEAAKTLEEIAGTVAGVGEIAGTILGAGAVKPSIDIAKAGGAKALEATKPVVGAGKQKVGEIIGKGKEKIVGTPEEVALKHFNDVLEITKPVLGKKESISAFEKAGKPGGVMKEKGILGKYKVEPSQRDLDIANSVKDIVSAKQGPIDNIVSVNSEIGRISDMEIRPFLQRNPSIYNNNQLNSYIREKVDMPNFIKADPVLQRTYELARESMMEEAKKSPHTMEGLWDARIKFDNVAERQLGSLAPMSEKASAIKQAVLDTRRAVNDYIAENTPNGDINFKGQLRDLSHKYEARTNIAEQNYKLLDKNAIERWAKQNPQKASMVKAGLGVAGLGVAGGIVL